MEEIEQKHTQILEQVSLFDAFDEFEFFSSTKIKAPKMKVFDMRKVDKQRIYNTKQNKMAKVRGKKPFMQY